MTEGPGAGAAKDLLAEGLPLSGPGEDFLVAGKLGQPAFRSWAGHLKEASLWLCSGLQTLLKNRVEC